MSNPGPSVTEHWEVWMPTLVGGPIDRRSHHITTWGTASPDFPTLEAANDERASLLATYPRLRPEVVRVLHVRLTREILESAASQSVVTQELSPSAPDKP